MKDKDIVFGHKQQRAMDDYLEWLDVATSNGVIAEALKQYYQEDSEYFYTATVDGEVVEPPVFSKQDWIGVSGSMNNFIGGFSQNHQTSYNEKVLEGVAKEMYVNQNGVNVAGEPSVFDLDQMFWNGGTYRVEGIDDTDPRFVLGESDFYSYVSTSEALLREFHHALQEDRVTGNNIPANKVLKTRTAKRNDAAETFDEILQVENHFHKVGPVCLLAVERDIGGPEIYLIERSEEVLHEPGSYATVPAGEMTPDSNGSGDLDQTVVNELVEEVLGVSESHNPERAESNKIEQKIWSYKVADRINIERTGLGFTMNSPRPILAGLVYISDVDVGNWIREKLQTNWEVKQLVKYGLPFEEYPEEMRVETAAADSVFVFIEALRRLEEYGVDTGIDISVDIA